MPLTIFVSAAIVPPDMPLFVRGMASLRSPQPIELFAKYHFNLAHISSKKLAQICP
jgi:hypothetical protein